MTRSFLCVPLTALIFGCTGDGSDIGPDLPNRPGSSYQFILRHDEDSDAQPLGVSSARISIAGIGGAAVTRRSGRGEFRGQPTGTRNLTIDARNASARAGDMLAGYTVAIDMPGLDEVPYVLYVPDLAGSVATPVGVGVQAGLTHDDSANSGAVLTIAAGSIVGLGTASSADLRTGKLAIGNLPGTLPQPPGVVRLTSRAVLVSPTDFTCSPGASLSLPNEIGLAPAAGAELFRLDSNTGVWTKAADAITDGSGATINSAGGVTAAGLYCFTTTVATSTTVTGRVVDAENEPLEGVLVRAPQAFTRTDGSGNFVLPAVAAVDAQGNTRAIPVTLHGGRELRPDRKVVTVVLVPGAQDIGQTVLDSGRALSVRGLLINRGARERRQRVRVANSEGESSQQGFADGDGRFDFFDLDADDRISYVLARPDPQLLTDVLAAESVVFANAAQRELDSRWFFVREPWLSGIGGDATVFVLDAIGHGIVDGAAIVRDTGGGNVFQEETRDGRVFRFNFGDFDGKATAAIETTTDRETVVSACTIRRVRASRVEIPLIRARRPAYGGFDTFGRVTGSLAAVGNTRRIRATRLTAREDWFAEVFEGQSLLGETRTFVDPEVTTGIDFSIGVPSPAGTLSGVAGTVTGSPPNDTFRLDQFWFADTVVVPPGEETAIALGTGHPSDTDFALTNALSGLDPAITNGDLEVDLAVELSNGNFVDVARDVDGNHTASGVDAILRLPALSGALGGGRYVVGFGGEGTAGAETRTQRTFQSFQSSGPANTFLPVPTVTSPAAGASVPVGGFAVEYALPVGVSYTVINLRQEAAASADNKLRDWTVVLPPEDSRFDFSTLPDPSPTPLSAGTYTLTVTAARIQAGPLTVLTDPYDHIVGRWLGISAAERLVDAVSSTSFTITLL